MNNRPLLLCGLLLLLGACTRGPMQVDVPEAQRIRPDWTSRLVLHDDAMRECLATRTVPRYVAFLDLLPSGATGVTTVDADGEVEHCAYLDGAVIRREATDVSGLEIAEAGGVLFSLGPVMPATSVGVVLEEVLRDQEVIGWLYWPVVTELAEGGDDAPR